MNSPIVVFGVQRVDGTFFASILTELLVLLACIMHRGLMRRLGLWEYTEEQEEDEQTQILKQDESARDEAKGTSEDLKNVTQSIGAEFGEETRAVTSLSTPASSQIDAKQPRSPSTLLHTQSAFSTAPSSQSIISPSSLSIKSPPSFLSNKSPTSQSTFDSKSVTRQQQSPIRGNNDSRIPLRSDGQTPTYLGGLQRMVSAARVYCSSVFSRLMDFVETSRLAGEDYYLFYFLADFAVFVITIVSYTSFSGDAASDSSIQFLNTV